MMGLPDYNAWEIVKRTNACLMEDPIGCDSAKMKPLRTQRAAGQEKSWPNIRSQLIPTSINTRAQSIDPSLFKAALLPYMLVLLECPTF